MPIYEFEDAKTGEGYEEFFPGAEAPKVGSYIRRNGRRYRRVVSLSKVKPKVWDRQVVAQSLGLWDENAPHHNDKGEAVFTSQREIDEYCAKTGKVYE